MIDRLLGAASGRQTSPLLAVPAVGFAPHYRTLGCLPAHPDSGLSLVGYSGNLVTKSGGVATSPQACPSSSSPSTWCCASSSCSSSVSRGRPPGSAGHVSPATDFTPMHGQVVCGTTQPVERQSRPGPPPNRTREVCTGATSASQRSRIIPGAPSTSARLSSSSTPREGIQAPTVKPPQAVSLSRTTPSLNL